jgi:glycine/D-amino acid oxidase-like deaminating enzyme
MPAGRSASQGSVPQVRNSILLEMKPDVVVVGGGAIGVCSALELARRGARVTLLERGPGLASGCSAGSAGLICPSHSTPISNPASLRNGLRWLVSALTQGSKEWVSRFTEKTTALSAA